MTVTVVELLIQY